jgi:hypothetical protein
MASDGADGLPCNSRARRFAAALGLESAAIRSRAQARRKWHDRTGLAARARDTCIVIMDESVRAISSTQPPGRHHSGLLASLRGHANFGIASSTPNCSGHLQSRVFAYASAGNAPPGGSARPSLRLAYAKKARLPHGHVDCQRQTAGCRTDEPAKIAPRSTSTTSSLPHTASGERGSRRSPARLRRNHPDSRQPVFVYVNRCAPFPLRRESTARVRCCRDGANHPGEAPTRHSEDPATHSSFRKPT